MNQPAKSLHPVVLIAAIAVTLLCITGIAAIMGWLPTSKSNTENPAFVAGTSLPATELAPATEPAATEPAATEPAAPEAVPAQPAPVAAQAEKPAPAPKPAAKSSKSKTTVAETQPAAVEPPPVAVARCYDCGVIESIHTVTHKGEGTGIGAVGGAVVGGVLGNQVGEGTGKRIARIGGAVLGGFAGNEVEKRARSETHYQINVRMDDGSIRTVQQKSAPAWQQGQRVRVENGVIHADNG